MPLYSLPSTKNRHQSIVSIIYRNRAFPNSYLTLGIRCFTFLTSLNTLLWPVILSLPHNFGHPSILLVQLGNNSPYGVPKRSLLTATNVLSTSS